jgi:PhzF family phenazine biosynthesis protein
MTILPIYQFDAFAKTVMKGNPAAVVPLASWLDDPTLQAIAGENNLSETAFVLGGEGRYQLRWFTPTAEVDLCGHATLASAAAIFRFIEPTREQLVFSTRSGELIVERQGDLLQMDFPLQPSQPLADELPLERCFGVVPHEQWLGPDLMLVFDDAYTIRQLRPDFTALMQLPGRGVICTAPGDDCDFVSRFFAPKYGINEDPVTGSAHCQLAPYWTARLRKTRLQAQQVSARLGIVECELADDRVLLRGTARLFLQGEIFLDDETADS